MVLKTARGSGSRDRERVHRTELNHCLKGRDQQKIVLLTGGPMCLRNNTNDTAPEMPSDSSQ